MLLYKEFKITSFDPALAAALGIPVTLIHYLLMTMVSITAVASFDAVGAILVVALFIVPPATAYLLTEKLSRHDNRECFDRHSFCGNRLLYGKVF